MKKYTIQALAAFTLVIAVLAFSSLAKADNSTSPLTNSGFNIALTFGNNGNIGVGAAYIGDLTGAPTLTMGTYKLSVGAGALIGTESKSGNTLTDVFLGPRFRSTVTNGFEFMPFVAENIYNNKWVAQLGVEVKLNW
jgi:hypothetical protein